MIGRNDLRLDNADHIDESVTTSGNRNDDGFWGLNSVIEEYHYSQRRNGLRSGKNVASLPLGSKALLSGESMRQRTQAWHDGD
jgi:hypothetical protein